MDASAHVRFPPSLVIFILALHSLTIKAAGYFFGQHRHQYAQRLHWFVPPSSYLILFSVPLTLFITSVYITSRRESLQITFTPHLLRAKVGKKSLLDFARLMFIRDYLPLRSFKYRREPITLVLKTDNIDHYWTINRNLPPCMKPFSSISILTWSLFRSRKSGRKAIIQAGKSLILVDIGSPIETFQLLMRSASEVCDVPESYSRKRSQ